MDDLQQQIFLLQPPGHDPLRPPLPTNGVTAANGNLGPGGKP